MRSAGCLKDYLVQAVDAILDAADPQEAIYCTRADRDHDEWRADSHFVDLRGSRVSNDVPKEPSKADGYAASS